MRPDGPVLFISHKKQQCGVYQYGLSVSKALEASSKFSFRYLECNDPQTFLDAVAAERPAAIIYNHHPATMPWLSRDLIGPIKIPHLGVMHENTQALADAADDRLFDYHVAPDPTLLLRNPIVFKTGRLVPRYRGREGASKPTAPVIGSFGFGTLGKGFERLISKVQEDFDEATIKLRIPYSAFYDPDGEKARAIGAQCRKLIVKPGIALELHHDFLSQDGLLDFLAENSLNAFLYEDQTGRGISSVIDFALAVDRPVAVTRSSMFRHINATQPSIVVEESRLSDILARGSAPISHYAVEWTAENLVWDYERIVASVLSASATATAAGNESTPRSSSGAQAPRRSVEGEAVETVYRASKALIRRVGPAVRSTKDLLMSSPLRGLVQAAQEQPLVRAGLGAVRSYLATNPFGPPAPIATTEPPEPRWAECVPSYRPDGPMPGGFNRILGPAAKTDHKLAMEYLVSQIQTRLPTRGPRATIEQAFVVDAVSRLTGHIEHPSLLGVNSHGMPATIALAMSGRRLEEVDPIVNYDLETYITKPTRTHSSFDVVFVASVMGRNTVDAQLLRRIESLLSPEGVAVLTCAFHPGDDNLDRLLPLMSHCRLVDSPRWRIEDGADIEPASSLAVATLVFRKVTPH